MTDDDKLDECVAIVEAIDELRHEELWSVYIHHDNPDFGVPENVVEVDAPYSGGEATIRFEGKSLLGALKAAVEWKRSWEKAGRPDLGQWGFPRNDDVPEFPDALSSDTCFWCGEEPTRWSAPVVVSLYGDESAVARMPSCEIEHEEATDADPEA